MHTDDQFKAFSNLNIPSEPKLAALYLLAYIENGFAMQGTATPAHRAEIFGDTRKAAEHLANTEDNSTGYGAKLCQWCSISSYDEATAWDTLRAAKKHYLAKIAETDGA